MELLHLRAGVIRAVVLDWPRRPLRARSLRDILGSLINIVVSMCVNGEKSEMLCSLNGNLGECGERLASALNVTPRPTESPTRGNLFYGVTTSSRLPLIQDLSLLMLTRL